MPTISLKTKVILPVTLMILTAFLVALFVINHVIRRQVMSRINQDLHKSKLVFSELDEKEREILLDRALITAEAPHLKAAVDTKDPATVQKVANEFFKTVRSDILLLADDADRILANNGVQAVLHNKNVGTLIRIETETTEGSFGLIKLNGTYYKVVTVPIVIGDNIFGEFILGNVILGNAINRDYLERLKTLVGAEVAMLIDTTIVATTLEAFSRTDKGTLTSLLRQRQNRIELAGEEFLIESAGYKHDYLMLQSIDQAFDSTMRPIETTILFVGFFAVIIAFLISTYLSLEIIAPIKRLDEATDAVTEEDYEHPIEVTSKDEIGQLAKKFNGMRTALKQKMSQLKQQNTELQNALKKLESAQKELLRAEKLAATGKITAQLSHELNNPIHNIRGCLEAAQRKLQNDGASKEFIDLAHKEVTRMGELIQQMLNFYRPQVISRSIVDVNNVVSEVLKASENRLTESGITIRQELSPNLSGLNSSADQLKQVFLNIISNAIDAMPAGGELKVRSCQNDDMITISFTDTGCGIKKEFQDKIFDAFFTTKEKASGVGLGLSVSYGLIQSLNGSIKLNSEPGKGSQFTIELPHDTTERLT